MPSVGSSAKAPQESWSDQPVPQHMPFLFKGRARAGDKKATDGPLVDNETQGRSIIRETSGPVAQKGKKVPK
eukprot:1278840-Amphidinium_carterae.1